MPKALDASEAERLMLVIGQITPRYDQRCGVSVALANARYRAPRHFLAQFVDALQVDAKGVAGIPVGADGRMWCLGDGSRLTINSDGCWATPAATQKA